MNAPTAKLFVAVTDDAVWIRIFGRANFASSIDFKTLMSELWHKGFHHYVIDLSDCALMDSTFLGTLAGFGLKLGNGGAQQPQAQPHPIELRNANARIAELLENLGAIHLFTMASGQPAIPTAARTQESETQMHSKDDLKRCCLEAHETLMEISPGNVRKFTDVTQFLGSGLQNVKPKPE